MPKGYAAISDKIYNFDVRPDDVWVITYPKCGTTWTQEIMWHIMNDVNKEMGKMPLFARSPFLEYEGLAGKGMVTKMMKVDAKQDDHTGQFSDNSVDRAANMPSPRIIKSHMPFEFLPPNLIDKAKVIYVCRNPKDCCVSYYHHMNDTLSQMYEYNGTFDQFVELFMQGKLEYGSYFEHLRSAWKYRNHPNMKFVWYEDMKKDTIKEVTEMAKFVNHSLLGEKIAELVEHLKFDNMKERATALMGGNNNIMTKFFRKGAVGDWKNYFEGDKLTLWDEWIAKNLKGSDFKFRFE